MRLITTHERALRTADPASIDDLRSCADELSMHGLLRAMLHAAGIDSFLFLFHSVGPGNPPAPRHRLQIGCTPEFTQLYVARRWYANDPAIQHARKSCAVVLLDDLPILSLGQGELRETSRRMGFRSAIVIPAHSGHSERFGVLVLGTDDAPESGHPMLSAMRVTLRSVAMELLDWWTVHTREEARQRLALSELELMILSLQRREYRGSDIACELGLSQKTIHNAVRTIKEKFGAANIAMAVAAAEGYGLI